MYFYKKNGKIHLDLTGDLLLTFNDAPVKARSKSAGPASVTNIQYVELNKLKILDKIRATLMVIGFIWGKSRELKREDTGYRESHRANVTNIDNARS